MLHRIAVVLAVVCFIASGTAMASVPSFTTVPIIPPDTGLYSATNQVGWQINSTGQVVGYVNVKTAGMDPGRNNGWFGDGTATTDVNLNGINGVAYPNPYLKASQAFAINDSGAVGGVAITQESSARNLAFVTSGGAMYSLDMYDTGIGQSRAYAINSSGVAVGQAYWGTNQWKAMVYTYSGTYSNGVYSGGSWSYNNINSQLGNGCSNAMGINSAGMVVGSFNTTTASLAYGSYPHAYVWNAGGMTDLGVPTGMDASWGMGINANNDVVGYAYLTSTSSIGTAFLATQASGYAMNLLQLPSGYTYSQALGINMYDMVVGYMNNGTNRAAIWTDGTVSGLPAGAIDLNALNTYYPGLVPTGWVLTTARSINDSGQITGVGTYGGQSRAFILQLPVPTPEPSTLLLTASGLVGLLAYAWRRRK